MTDLVSVNILWANMNKCPAFQSMHGVNMLQQLTVPLCLCVYVKERVGLIMLQLSSCHYGRKLL